jgi:hypothetical protein
MNAPASCIRVPSKPTLRWPSRACASFLPKRDLVQCEKIVVQSFAQRDLLVSKETYYSVKRDLLHCQKRPITVSQETYYRVKRDILQSQKRPSTVSKETLYSVKRDLLQCQKRPVVIHPSAQRDQVGGDRKLGIKRSMRDRAGVGRDERWRTSLCWLCRREGADKRAKKKKRQRNCSPWALTKPIYSSSLCIH